MTAINEKGVNKGVGLITAAATAVPVVFDVLKAFFQNTETMCIGNGAVYTLPAGGMGFVLAKAAADTQTGKKFLENCGKMLTRENVCVAVGAILGCIVLPTVPVIAQQFDPDYLPVIGTATKFVLGTIGIVIGAGGGAFVADKIAPKIAPK